MSRVTILQTISGSSHKKLIYIPGPTWEQTGFIHLQLASKHTPWNIPIDPEHRRLLVKPHFPSPIWRGLC